jgi:hypothetical protein
VLRIALAVLLCSCATTATLVTQQGTLEATINGSDADSLLVTNDVGVKRRILREDILEVDHPGNVIATVFGIAAGVLAAETAGLALSANCTSSGGGSGPGPCVAAGSVGVASIALFAVGLYTWVTSRNAVFNPPPASDGEMSKYPFAFPRGGTDVAPPQTPVDVPPPPSL